MMTEIIAYCGLACHTCPIYLATRQENKAEQQRIRTEIAQMLKEHYGMNYAPEQINDCDGCRTEGDRLFSGCRACRIRTCARKRGLESCAYCTEYACEQLLEIFASESTAEIRLGGSRNTKEFRKKLHYPRTIHGLFRHRILEYSDWVTACSQCTPQLNEDKVSMKVIDFTAEGQGQDLSAWKTGRKREKSAMRAKVKSNKLARLVSVICEGTYREIELTEFVNLVHKIALSYLKYQEVMGKRILRERNKNMGALDDLARDCVAGLFMCNESGDFIQFKKYFAQSTSNLEHLNDVEILVLLRRLVIKTTKQKLARIN